MTVGSLMDIVWSIQFNCSGEIFLPFPWRDHISLATIFVHNVLPWLRREQGKLIFLAGQQTRKTRFLDGLRPPSNTPLTWR